MCAYNTLYMLKLKIMARCNLTPGLYAKLCKVNVEIVLKTSGNMVLWKVIQIKTKVSYIVTILNVVSAKTLGLNDVRIKKNPESEKYTKFKKT